MEKGYALENKGNNFKHTNTHINGRLIIIRRDRLSNPSAYGVHTSPLIIAEVRLKPVALAIEWPFVRNYLEMRAYNGN